MKLFLYHIIGNFFFEPVPLELDGFEEIENVTRKVSFPALMLFRGFRFNG